MLKGKNQNGALDRADGQATLVTADEEDRPSSQPAALDQGSTAAPLAALEKGSRDPKTEAYSCFSSREKWGIISLISLASIFS
jgi:hypothetical protein